MGKLLTALFLLSIAFQVQAQVELGPSFGMGNSNTGKHFRLGVDVKHDRFGFSLGAKYLINSQLSVDRYFFAGHNYSSNFSEHTGLFLTAWYSIIQIEKTNIDIGGDFMYNADQRIHRISYARYGTDSISGLPIYRREEIKHDPYKAIDLCAWVGLETIIFHDLRAFARVGWGFAYYIDLPPKLSRVSGPNISEGQRVFLSAGFVYRFEIGRSKLE